MKPVRSVLAAAAMAGLFALSVTGCGGETDTTATSGSTVTVTATPSSGTSGTPSRAPLTTATSYAAAIDKSVNSAIKVTTLTEKNDSNNLIGRPNGYVTAAVITDEDGNTSDKAPGVAYGATVEMFSTGTEAARRSNYIQGLLKDAPMLGTEYDYVHGAVLLRVSGELRPSVAKDYRAAFDAAAE